MSADQVTEPLAADPRLRTLLDRVQAAYGEITGEANAGNSVRLPVRAPSVPEGLVERIMQARALVVAMRPMLDQVCGTYADAVHLAGAFYGPSVADDLPCDQFMQAIGADDLASAVYDLTGWLPL